MTEIHVRPIRFDFEPEIDLDLPKHELTHVLTLLGLSLTMPYLEPYLIRTMKAALKELADPALQEDARHFSQQEGHHYRNHANFNRYVRDRFAPEVAAEIQAIEDALEADYQRYTRERSLAFNAAYAEGFEAMTCSFALASATHGGFANVPGGEIWAWHMAEEIEHRTVAFDVHEALVGSYWHRALHGTWAQLHYLSYILRFARCMARPLGHRLTILHGPMHRDALRRWSRTLLPGYDPAKIPMPDIVPALLAHYDERATAPTA